ncbi:Peptidyl-prolyl cis-trans isomerase (fragment) [Capnocytophaga canimorsus]|uniref:Peptidyl-prolyl cis-trans isomerase n=1 Tax=Capnocytophaga canimorsus TaxID=28188 RepID=A0A0B7I687_9FLAO
MLLGCTDRPARRPVTVKTNTFLKESDEKKQRITQGRRKSN